MKSTTRRLSKIVKKTIGYLLAAALLTLYFSPYAYSLRNLPENMILYSGEELRLNWPLGSLLSLEGTNVNVISQTGDTLSEVDPDSAAEQISLSAGEKGNGALFLKLFGLVPVKQISLEVRDRRSVIVGGNCIGISLYTQGALVVGLSDVGSDGSQLRPAKDAGIKAGDVIKSVNSVNVESAVNLTELVNKSDGKELSLGILRDNKLISINVVPAYDSYDGCYRLGLWVRDSTMGIGTLSFIDPESGIFATLGHPITDADTGTILSVKNGTIVSSVVSDVKKGSGGNPGELRGTFDLNDNILGDIVKNTEIGIYGKLRENTVLEGTRVVEVAKQDEVIEGEAVIYTTVEGSTPKEYTVNIVKKVAQTSPASKGLVIEVTDPRLIELTGGIVQGMSGSPILQNGRLVGIVTHVFVNNPLKGYGIYADWMLSECDTVFSK